MNKLVICDLDGTLSDASHRQPLVQNGRKEWTAFYAAAHLDPPKLPMIAVLHALHAQGYEIWIWSGRSDEVHAQTMDWLHRHVSTFDLLKMRTAGDYTPDDKLKMSWYDALHQEFKDRLMLTFDDRDRMVNAWRSRGVTCFQVAPGDF